VFLQFSVDIHADSFGFSERANAFKNADFEVGSSHSAGKSAERAVRASVRIAHNYGKARLYKALFGKNCVANTVFADVKEVFYAVSVRPIAKHFALNCAFCVFCGSDVVDNRFDFRVIENSVFFACFQVRNSNRRGDFVAENSVQIQYECSLKRLVP
jgi:hypothetical protein